MPTGVPAPLPAPDAATPHRSPYPGPRLFVTGGVWRRTRSCGFLPVGALTRASFADGRRNAKLEVLAQNPDAGPGVILSLDLSDRQDPAMASALRLHPAEQDWLDAYRRELTKRHPDAVRTMFIYGSKARGEGGDDSDLDVLLLVRNEAVGLKRALRRIGYQLSSASHAVPSILAYTEGEWEHRRRLRAPFLEAVERDAVRVL